MLQGKGKGAVGTPLKSDSYAAVDWAKKPGLQIEGKTCQNEGTKAFGR
ncbi:hypothetical protein OAA48_00805 [bacterium]|nr:hypothetical protein [bacterium]